MSSLPLMTRSTVDYDYMCPRCGRTGNRGEVRWRFFSTQKFLEKSRLREPVCAWCARELLHGNLPVF